MDSVLGLQAAWRMTPQLSAVVRGMAKYTAMTAPMAEIAWAYLNYEPDAQRDSAPGAAGYRVLHDGRLPLGRLFTT